MRDGRVADEQVVVCVCYLLFALNCVIFPERVARRVVRSREQERGALEPSVIVNDDADDGVVVTTLKLAHRQKSRPGGHKPCIFSCSEEQIKGKYKHT